MTQGANAAFERVSHANEPSPLTRADWEPCARTPIPLIFAPRISAAWLMRLNSVRSPSPCATYMPAALRRSRVFSQDLLLARRAVTDAAECN